MRDPCSVRIMAAITVGTFLLRHEIEFNEVTPVRVGLLIILKALCGCLIL